MKKPEKYTDIVFMAFLGISLGIAIYMHFAGGYVLSVNYYIALALWAIVVISKIIRFKKEFFGVFSLLLLAIIGVINFSVYTINANTYHTDNGILYSGPGFNIYLIFPVIIYGAINAKMVTGVIKTLFKGSEAEQQANTNKLIDFYYEKFSVCDKTELDELMAKFKDYPYEAQVALRRIGDERNIMKQS